MSLRNAVDALVQAVNHHRQGDKYRDNMIQAHQNTILDAALAVALAKEKESRPLYLSHPVNSAPRD